VNRTGRSSNWLSGFSSLRRFRPMEAAKWSGAWILRDDFVSSQADQQGRWLCTNMEQQSCGRDTRQGMETAPRARYQRPFFNSWECIGRRYPPDPVVANSRRLRCSDCCSAIANGEQQDNLVPGELFCSFGNVWHSGDSAGFTRASGHSVRRLRSLRQQAQTGWQRLDHAKAIGSLRTEASILRRRCGSSGFRWPCASPKLRSTAESDRWKWIRFRRIFRVKLASCSAC
jgi:hypothetical protein